MTADGGATALRIYIDGTPYLLVLVGDDEELHRLMHHVHHLIHTDGEDKEEYVAVNHFFPVAQGQVAGRDNRNVYQQNKLAKRNVVILVNHGRNHVGAASRSIAGQSQPHGAAQTGRTQHDGHEGLALQKRGAFHPMLPQCAEKREHHSRIERFKTELPTQYL